MLRKVATASALVAMALTLTPVVGARASDRIQIHAPYEDGTVLVGFTPGTSQQQQQGDVQSVGALDEGVIGAGTHKLKVASGQVGATIAALEHRPGVRFVEPNYIVHAMSVPNDPLFPNLWAFQNTGQVVVGRAGTAGADIKALAAWSITTGSPSVVVGDVDSGVDYTHKDLIPNLWVNPAGIGGCPAGTYGFNIVYGGCDVMDDYNHGTHVMGTIGAAGNNGTGVVGVNWHTSLMALKFLDANGYGTDADAISAIDAAIQAKLAGVNVRVLSNPWGEYGYSQALLDEINKAGANDILIVAAAGNDGVSNDTTPSPIYPCAYAAANEVCVAATDQNDQLASFSSYGAATVDLAAPGTNILSTWSTGTLIGSGPTFTSDGALYHYGEGTSMATAMVAGAAALILSTGYQSATQLKATLRRAVDPEPSLAGKTVSGGRLDVCKAIPGCGALKPDFALLASPSSQTVTQGASTSYTVTVTPSGGFSGTVTFGVSGLPTGATVSFNPTSVAGSGTSTLTVSTAANTAAVSYPLTITGASGALSHSTTATLVVNAAPPPGWVAGAVGTDPELYVLHSGSPSFIGLGGVLLGAPAVVAIPQTSGPALPLYIATGSDHALWVRNDTRGWQILSGNPTYCIDNPAGAVIAGTLYVACQGIDHALWHAETSAPSGTNLPALNVSSWRSLGGALGAGPAIASVAGTPTYVVVGSDTHVYFRDLTSPSFRGFTWACIGHPALATFGTTSYFACHGTGGALWYSTNTGSGWSSIQPLGGQLVDGVGVAATATGPIFFVEGVDGAVYHRSISSGWTVDGGQVKLGVGACAL
jgi:Subtilase family